IGDRGAAGDSLVAAVAEGKGEGDRATAELIGAKVVGRTLGTGLVVIIGGDVGQDGSGINGGRSGLEVEVVVDGGVYEPGVSSEVVGKGGVCAAVGEVFGIVVGDVAPHLGVGHSRGDLDPLVATI